MEKSKDISYLYNKMIIYKNLFQVISVNVNKSTRNTNLASYFYKLLVKEEKILVLGDSYSFRK